jgi:hypothetical protein
MLSKFCENYCNARLSEAKRRMILRIEIAPGLGKKTPAALPLRANPLLRKI